MQAADENSSGLGVFRFHSRFPGQWHDPETGLYHNGFRDYHAGLGRYVQSDPLGLEAGWNTYSYVSSAPMSNIDFYGLSSHDYLVKIPKIMEKTVNTMIGSGERAYGYDKRSAYANNILLSLGKENFKPCIGQSDKMFEDLVAHQNSGGFDDKWMFLKGRNRFHHWVIGISSNKNDPILLIDPWTFKIMEGRSGYGYNLDSLSHERVEQIRSWHVENNRNGGGF